MQIVRATDAARINEILNHPEVRGDVMSHVDSLDLTVAVHDRQNFFLIGDRQAVLCFPVIEGLYEFHVAALPEGRGAEMVEFCRLAEVMMFTGTPCVELLTRIPVTHQASEGLAKLRHFKSRWERPDTLFRGEHVAYRVWSKTMQEWLQEYDIADVIETMKINGMVKKAEAWHRRWSFLSREPAMRLDS